MNQKPKHLQSFWNKKNILFVSLALILAACLGVTTAWLTGKDGSGAYSFDGAYVTCQVTDSYNNATVTNTGNVNAHIRVKVITHYREKLGNGIYGNLFWSEPVLGTDYSIDYNLTDWVKGNDGYYYYRYPVAPDTKTARLVTNFSLINSGGVPSDAYELRVEYLAEAIQSDPGGAPAKEAWKAHVDGNNHITGADGFTN